MEGDDGLGGGQLRAQPVDLLRSLVSNLNAKYESILTNAWPASYPVTQAQVRAIYENLRDVAQIMSLIVVELRTPPTTHTGEPK